jgi:hypothetical protein
MPRHPRRVVLAAALLAATCGLAATPIGSFDATSAAALHGVPVDVVVLNDRVRAQIAYQYVSVDPNGTIAQGAMMPGMPAGAGMAGAAGGALAGALINASMRAAATAPVQPAYASLVAAQCAVPGADALARDIEASVRATPWGGDAQVNRYVLVSEEGPSRVALKEDARVVVSATYSLSPDFSTLVTSLTASAYSGALPGAPKDWQRQPAWSDQLVVVSDRLDVGAKTPEDAAHLVALENAAHQATLNALIDKANAGDRDARDQIKVEKSWHNGRLRAANAPEWTEAGEILRRSELWSQDGCARLKQAMQANDTEIRRMLDGLFAGRAPDATSALPRTTAFVTRAAVAAAAVEPAAPAGERRIVASPGNLRVSQRAGDKDVPLLYLYSWLPLENQAKP